jgi:hypothetical protein
MIKIPTHNSTRPTSNMQPVGCIHRMHSFKLTLKVKVCMFFSKFLYRLFLARRADRRPDGVCTLPIPVATVFFNFGESFDGGSYFAFLLCIIAFGLYRFMIIRPTTITATPTINATLSYVVQFEMELEICSRHKISLRLFLYHNKALMGHRKIATPYFINRSTAR